MGHRSRGGPINPDSMKIVELSEFDFSQTQVVYEQNGVRVTSFPVVHALSRRCRLSPRFRRLVVRLLGRQRAPAGRWARACEGVDLLIHERRRAWRLRPASAASIERAMIALNAAHTSPKAVGKGVRAREPRVAGLWQHTLLAPQVISLLFSELRTVYNGPVVQTQDLTVFNVTKEAVVARQAQVMPQLPPIPGVQRAAFKPVAVPPPDWWAEALIPLD